MPAEDKTGPDGKGPKTGRGLGECTEEDVKNPKTSEVTDVPRGRGRGRGKGGRRRL